MKFGLLLLSLFLVSCKTTSNNSSSIKQKEKIIYSVEEGLALDFIEYTGKMIWIKDSLAWQATDLLVAKADLNKYKNGKGWLVNLEVPETPTVTFYHELDGSLNIIADVIFDSDFQNPKLNIEPDRKISDTELNMLTARVTASSAITEACSERLNSVVLPIKNGWQVYLLTSTTEPNVIPAGGHRQIITSPDGKTILSNEAYSKSCFKLQVPDENSNVAALMMTHIVSDMPAPTHVFHSLQFGIPLFVSTKKGLWKVEGDKVSLIKRD